eukprot:4423417-Alexandrium_andersonii.AAC.1
MSASLVGSEMCIRDSSESARKISAERTPRELQGPILRFSRVRAIQAPVSYTHLTLPTICSV